MGTLNRKRTFEHVFGNPEIPHAYEQDGKMFDWDGNEVGEDGQPIPKTTKAPTGMPVPNIPAIPELPEDTPDMPEVDLTLKPEFGRTDAGEVPAVNEDLMTRHMIMDILDEQFPAVKYDKNLRRSVLLDILNKAKAASAEGGK